MKQSQEHEERSAKLPYNSPEFRKYGSIARLTQSRGTVGNIDNPGNPSTRKT
jgi:hypothetical protein